MEKKLLVDMIENLKKDKTINQIIKERDEISEILDKNKENYGECLKLFFRIFTKLNPKKKILDIPLSKESPNSKIVLHRFGFMVLWSYKERPSSVDIWNLFDFLKNNDSETFDNVADEIKYTEIRKMFRLYCKTVGQFLQDNKVESFNEGIKSYKISVSFQKGRLIKNLDGQKAMIKHIEIENDENDINIKCGGHGYFRLNSIESLNDLALAEQIKIEIAKGLSLLKEEVKEDSGKIKSKILMEQLKKHFGSYLLAEKI